MKKFFKPTKGKVILAIPLLLLTFLIEPILLEGIFGESSQELCLPSLPSASGESVPLPTPTPQPFTFSNVISDMQYESYTSGGENCLGNGSSVRLATFLITSYQFILSILLFIFPIFVSYLISCTIIFCVARLKRQKK